MIFYGPELVYCKCSSSVLHSMVSFNLQHCRPTGKSEGYLVIAMASIVLPSMVTFDLQSCTVTIDGYQLTAILLSSFKISQLTNVHNYKLQAFLSVPVYFSSFNFEMINPCLIIKCLDMII